jgi:glycosyltransferase involved in cell wall biosynthesis
VSVIVPAFNQGRFLGEALDSVLGQTHQDLEVVVVDDGSTDETAEVVRSRRDPRVRYIHQENQGLSAARNTGIHESTGAWLSFLDADDAFLPEKLSRLLALAQENPGAGLVAGQAIPIDEDGQPTGAVFDCGAPSRPEDWLLGNPLHVGSVILRRAWQETVGRFDVSLRSYEDWDLWLRLALAGCPMLWLPHPVSLYRFHRAQMIRDGRRMTEANLAVLEKVFSRPDLPESWRANRRRAYSRAELRAAANAYGAGNLEIGKAALLQAVDDDPSLLHDGGRPLREIFFAWGDFPKTDDRMRSLQQLHDNLPASLRPYLSKKDLAEAALRVGVEAYQRGDRHRARTALWKGIRLDPRHLRNRGMVSMLLRSLEPGLRRSPVEGVRQ